MQTCEGDIQPHLRIKAPFFFSKFKVALCF